MAEREEAAQLYKPEFNGASDTFTHATEADVLRAAARVMTGWPRHAPYTQSGRGRIAVEELRWLADRIEEENR